MEFPLHCDELSLKQLASVLEIMEMWSGNGQLNNGWCSPNWSDSRATLGRSHGQAWGTAWVFPSMTVADLLTGPGHLCSSSWVLVANCSHLHPSLALGWPWLSCPEMPGKWCSVVRRWYGLKPMTGECGSVTVSSPCLWVCVGDNLCDTFQSSLRSGGD